MLARLCALAGLLALAVLPSAHASSMVSRVQYHTASGLLEPGCARSFHYSVPATVSADGSRTIGAFSLNVTVDRFVGKYGGPAVPVISNQIPAGEPGYTEFDFCYNSAYLPLFDKNADGSQSASVRHALLLRCQDLKDPKDPYAVGPSYMAIAVEALPAGSQQFVPVKRSDVVFKPTLPYENFGVEDPRVVYDAESGEYMLFYSAVADNGGLISRLSLATTSDPRNISAWTKHGPIIKDKNDTNPDPLADYSWSKSGALLRAPAGQKSLLIFGDSNHEHGVQTAAPSADFLSYTYNATVFLPMRDKPYFESALVESGPPPLPLATNSSSKSGQPPAYFFLYNSARGGYPSAKPGWDLQYNVGFALLDGRDPDTVLLRSDQPILSPELGWEQGTAPFLGLTPNVVFVEGARLANGEGETASSSSSTARRADGSSTDRIVAWYGAADSTVGAMIVTVEYTPSGAEEAEQQHHHRKSPNIELE